MSLQEIKDIFVDNSGFWTAVVIAFLTLVEITPIKINPWSWFAKKLGVSFNGDLMKEIQTVKTEMSDVKKEVQVIKKDVTDIREEAKEREATNRRTRILEFGDEIRHGVNYSKEHFDQVLLDITEYENYCDGHPGYMNNVAKATIEQIETVYQKCLLEDSFL